MQTDKLAFHLSFEKCVGMLVESKEQAIVISKQKDCEQRVFREHLVSPVVADMQPISWKGFRELQTCCEVPICFPRGGEDPPFWCQGPQDHVVFVPRLPITHRPKGLCLLFSACCTVRSSGETT